jgi:general secretion pathway protein D
MTVVIGGLMTDQLVNTVSKIPILGDIPWLGTAFRRTTTEKTKTELIIFLTPTVVEKTPSLKDLSIAETKHVELASTAFDEKALNKNLDDWQTLLPRPKPTPPPGGFWRRTMGEIASAFSIFR